MQFKTVEGETIYRILDMLTILKDGVLYFKDDGCDTLLRGDAKEQMLRMASDEILNALEELKPDGFEEDLHQEHVQEMYDDLAQEER